MVLTSENRTAIAESKVSLVYSGTHLWKQTLNAESKVSLVYSGTHLWKQTPNARSKVSLVYSGTVLTSGNRLIIPSPR